MSPYRDQPQAVYSTVAEPRWPRLLAGIRTTFAIAAGVVLIWASTKLLGLGAMAITLIWMAIVALRMAWLESSRGKAWRRIRIERQADAWMRALSSKK